MEETSGGRGAVFTAARTEGSGRGRGAVEGTATREAGGEGGGWKRPRRGTVRPRGGERSPDTPLVPSGSIEALQTLEQSAG